MKTEEEINEFTDWAFQNIITKSDFKSRLIELMEDHHSPKTNETPTGDDIFLALLDFWEKEHMHANGVPVLLKSSFMEVEKLIKSFLNQSKR